MKKYGLIAVVCSVLSGCLTGCVAHGHRKVEIEVLGNTFRVEDEVISDDKGKQDYSASFDGNLWKVVFGWLAPEPKPDDSANDDG